MANNNGIYVSNIDTSSHDYSFTLIEASPLARLLSHTPPDRYPTLHRYGTNTATDTVTGFAPTTLFKYVTIDPEGNVEEIYADQRNRKILKRKLDPNLQNANNTYTLWNNLDRKTNALPHGMTTGDANSIYSFLYHPNGQLKIRDLPDAEPIEYLYNERDLLAYVQDGEMKNEGKWYAKEYDVYGKLLKEGFYKGVPLGNGTFQNAVILSGDELITNTFAGNSGIGLIRPFSREVKILNTGDFIQNSFEYDLAGRTISRYSNALAKIDPFAFPPANKRIFTYDSKDNVLSENIRMHIYGGHYNFTKLFSFDFAGRADGESIQELNDPYPLKLTQTSYTAKNQVDENIMYLHYYL